MTDAKKPYPMWVCNECAIKAGGVTSRCSTYHSEKCDVCRKVKAVTQPRDFGYPRFKGHDGP